MKASTARIAALLALCPLLSAAQFDCYPSGYEVARYDLSRCPDSSWTLPKKVQGPGLQLTGYGRFPILSPRPEPQCQVPPGFLAYVTRDERGKDQLHDFDLRVNRGRTCSVDIVRTYLSTWQTPGIPRNFPVEAMADEQRRVAALARIVVAGSGATIASEPSAMAYLTGKEFKRWCKAGPGHPLPTDSG